MDSAHVVGVAFQDRFQHAHDLSRAFARSAIDVPQTPWMQVHHAFRVHRGGVQIVGKALRQCAHGIFVCDCELLVVRILRVCIALRERVDVRALTFGRF